MRRANCAVSSARAGSEVRSPTYRPPTITPGAIVGVRVAPGAAAQASATKTARTRARRSIGTGMVCPERREFHTGEDAVRGPPYREPSMQPGGWTIRPCPPAEVRALVRELG